MVQYNERKLLRRENKQGYAKVFHSVLGRYILIYFHPELKNIKIMYVSTI